jgi:hypothetical protein
VAGVRQHCAPPPRRAVRDAAPLCPSIATPYVRPRGVVRGGRLAS